MPRLALAPSALGLCLAASIACSKHGAPEPGNSVRVPPLATSATPLASASNLPRALESKPACRALLVSGSAAIEGVQIVGGALLDGKRWLDIAAGASVSLRHTLTSREFKLIGPSRVLPCRNGAEQLLLATGQLSTSAHLGVRPGAEVLIATPSGTVRYGDAALDVEHGSMGLRVRVKQGEVWVEPEVRGKPRFENPVRSGEVRLRPALGDASALVGACQTAAQRARDSAEHVLGTGSSALRSLGARAAAHMRSRAVARSACAIAAAALGVADDPAENQRLSEAVARADELWQSVPRSAVQ